jgi:hypothetical protein
MKIHKITYFLENTLLYRFMALRRKKRAQMFLPRNLRYMKTSQCGARIVRYIERIFTQLNSWSYYNIIFDSFHHDTP